MTCRCGHHSDDVEIDQNPHPDTFLTPGGIRRTLPDRILTAEADDEPRFVIRGQDLLAPQAIAAYARLARIAGLDDFAREVEARAVEILQWQATHARLVKRPD